MVTLKMGLLCEAVRHVTPRGYWCVKVGLSASHRELLEGLGWNASNAEKGAEQ